MKKKKKIIGDETSTAVLKHLETSLRTNSIDWVRDFLSDENNGLKVLVQYIKHAQDAGGLRLPTHCGLNGYGSFDQTDQKSNFSPTTLYNTSSSSMTGHFGTLQSDYNSSGNNGTLNLGKKSSKFHATLKHVGNGTHTAEDDIHVGIQCLRAIMNNTYGFNMVFNDSEAIYCLVCSILHPSLRTKTSVLILLAAICLVKGGHELIIQAFNRFKIEYCEIHRFQTLFQFFRDPETFHVDFMVACMQFINIVVHSVDDKNYRIFLQHEFKLLGLDEYIDKLKQSESEEFLTQILAYLENMYDVAQLLEESDQKTMYQMKCDELQLEVSRAMEKIQEVEANYVMQVVRLDNRLAELAKERETLMSLHQRADNDLNTLRRVLSQKEQEAHHKQYRLESRIQELEDLQKSLRNGLITLNSSESISPHPPAPTPSIMMTSINSGPPPPAPPLPKSVVPPPPPISMLNLNQRGGPQMAGNKAQALPNLPNAELEALNIKRRIHTKYKLPQLNWTALKPNQLKGTIFSELDDDKVIDAIDFEWFEEQFKLAGAETSTPKGAGPLSGPTMGLKYPLDQQGQMGDSQNGATLQSSRRQTLLDHKRLRNLAITRRKLAIEPIEVARSVNNFDLQILDAENVEILLRVLPTAEEIKAYKDYEMTQKPIDQLTEEDKFLIQLSKIERLSQKLQIMSFMANFKESMDLLSPSLTTVIAASKSVKEARCFHKVLEIVLAFGNYMNSGKRGGVYGFKLQSLDVLPFLKAPGSKTFTLLHAIALSLREKYPELIKFQQELKFVEKASAISLDAVLADFNELEKLMELTKKECALRVPEVPQVLSQFLGQAESKLNDLKTNTKVAQESFRSCVEFYGESSKGTTTSSFFTILMNFNKHFQQADEENEARKKAEALQQSLNKRAASGPGSPKKSVANGRASEDLRTRQAAVIDELLDRRSGATNGHRARPPAAPSRKRDPGEMGLGTFDDIIHDITRKPYLDVNASKRQRASVREFGEAPTNRITTSHTVRSPIETEM